MCINPVALYTNTPKAQPITNMTAMMYNKLLIIFALMVNVLFSYRFFDDTVDSTIFEWITSLYPNEFITFFASSKLTETPET